MPLAIMDCKVGTIVDHFYDLDEDGQEVPREIIRRGIIVKIDGVQDSISKIHVKFKPDEPSEVVAGKLLNRVLKAEHRIAQEAYRRIMGQPKVVGMEYSQERRVARQKLQDSMALVSKKQAGPIKEKFEDEDILGLPDPEEPEAKEAQKK